MARIPARLPGDGVGAGTAAAKGLFCRCRGREAAARREPLRASAVRKQSWAEAVDRLGTSVEGARGR